MFSEFAKRENLKINRHDIKELFHPIAYAVLRCMVRMHRPSDDSGIVVAFRRPKSPDNSITVKLSGLNPEKTYAVTNFDNNIVLSKTGKELMSGFVLNVESERESLLLHYD